MAKIPAFPRDTPHDRHRRLEGKAHRSELHAILGHSDLSPITIDKYRRAIDMWIRFAGHDSHNWTPAVAQDFYEELLDSDRQDGRSGKRSIRTANTYIASLKYVSEWWARRGGQNFAIVQTLSPNRKGRAVPTVKTVAHALTPHEATTLLDVCNPQKPTIIDRRDRAMILLGLETGMRRKSLAGARIDGIERHPAFTTLTVPIKGAGGEETYPVPLTDLAYAVIDEWRSFLRRRKIDGPLFPAFGKTLDGREALSLDGIYSIITSRGDAANIRDLHPHILRHTFVTWRLDQGFNDIEIATITGHKFNAGGVGTYIDRYVIAQKIQPYTPPWLIDYYSNNWNK